MDQDTSTPSQQFSRAEDIALILTTCIISALLIYLVYLRSFVFGSVLGNWVDPYLSSVPVFPRWVPLIVLSSLGLLVFLGSKLIHSHERITLLVLFLFAFCTQALIRKIYPFSLGTIVQSDGANSFYTPALSYSTVEILSKFITLAPLLPLHAKANMPGKILLFELLRLITASPETMGYLIIFLSSLGTLLLYGICKRLFQNKLIAFYAATLYILLPGKLFFLPILNTVTPVLMLLCFYLFVIYLDTKNLWISLLLGVSGYILILFEPSPLITGVVLIGILIHAIREKRFSSRDFYRLVSYSSLGFLIMFILFYALFSFNIFQSFFYILKEQQNFISSYERGYLIWIIENSKDFYYGAGIPVMILFIYATALIFVQTKNLKNIAQWPLESIFTISILVAFLLLLFLGINRGEVIRLWIYLAVLFQIPASIFIAKIKKGGGSVLPCCKHVGDSNHGYFASGWLYKTLITYHHIKLRQTVAALLTRISLENRRVQA